MESIRKQLLNAGMDEKEIDNHESDLYVKVNDVSKKWLESYEYKTQVTTFIDEIEKKPWFEVPFGYMPEHYEKRKGGRK